MAKDGKEPREIDHQAYLPESWLAPGPGRRMATTGTWCVPWEEAQAESAHVRAKFDILGNLEGDSLSWILPEVYMYMECWTTIRINVKRRQGQGRSRQGGNQGSLTIS